MDAENPHLQHQWQEFIPDAEDTRSQYEEQMKYMMRYYSETPWKSSITETEVFVGSIVGREQSTKRQREWSSELKNQYEETAQYTMDQLKGETSEETVGRSMAALKICCPSYDKPSTYRLSSFAWLAASVLLTEVDKMDVKITPF